MRKDDLGGTPHPTARPKQRRRRLGPLESRGDILREQRKLLDDLLTGRIDGRQWGRRLYLLNLLLGKFR